MRRVAVGLFAAILVLFGGPAASASQPTHSRSVADVTFVDTSCGFRVRVHVTGYVVFIERTDARGNVHQFDSYPQLKQTLTNIATGKSINDEHRRARTHPPARGRYDPDGRNGDLALGREPGHRRAGHVAHPGTVGCRHGHQHIHLRRTRDRAVSNACCLTRVDP
jgi:hypothetical protein